MPHLVLPTNHAVWMSCEPSSTVDGEQIKHIKDHLHATFQINDLGSLKFFLGLEVSKSNKGICLTWRKYALELLDSVGLINCKPVKIPHSAIYKDQ